LPLESAGLSIGARSKFTPSNSIHFHSATDRAPNAPNHALSLFEIVLCKIVREKRLKWFGAQHAKTIQCIQKHQPVYLGDLIYLTGIEKRRQQSVLEQLQQKKFIQYNGSQFEIGLEETILHALLKEAEPSTR